MVKANNRRVVVTGLGIVSSIGHNAEQVTRALRDGASGIRHNPEYAGLGFRSQVCGPVEPDLAALIDRKILRFMGDAAAFNYLAMQQAIDDSGLGAALVSHPRTGLIVGTGGASTANVSLAVDTLRERGIRRVGPYMVPRTMSSTASACLGTAFAIKGASYSISSACSTSAHCIGHAAELIQLDKQDIVFAGGGEEVHWTLTMLFDAMGALSSKFNDSPERASRPYDAGRDGFVISGGGGVLVMEELQHARRRGARIIAELTGYAATSDGADMVQPSGEGAVRCMQAALAGADRGVDYVNAHGTSTPAGDIVELNALAEVFGGAGRVPPISATKSLSGHALGAAGVNEAVYTLLMMRNNFIAASANLETPDEGAAGFPIVTETRDGEINTALSNSFGFGGTNCCLVFSKVNL